METNKKMTARDLLEISKQSGIELAILQTILEVEANGSGFSESGKILIQFEPHWFKIMYEGWSDGENKEVWLNNKVENQSAEWKAFNSAFKQSPDDAMKSTSIGMSQIMGFHYKRLGFKTVGEMWDNFKESEKNQVLGMVKFIQTDKNLKKAIETKNWHLFATYYNGAKYKEIALKNKWTPYDEKLAKAYKKYSEK